MRNETGESNGPRRLSSPADKLLALSAGLLLIVATAGCGGNGDASAERRKADSDAAAKQVRSEASTPTGSGTMTVGDRTWEFDVFHCAFGPEEAGNPAILFSLSGKGEDGLRVNASRQMGMGAAAEGPPGRDPDAEPIDHADVRVGEVQDPKVHWVATSAGLQPPFLELEGKEVRGTAEFGNALSGGEPARAEGTLEATCP